MKIIVAIAFILILGSLASALFYLMRDKGKSNRTVQALALRVGLSITLFLLVLLAWHLGYSLIFASDKLSYPLPKPHPAP